MWLSHQWHLLSAAIQHRRHRSRVLLTPQRIQVTIEPSEPSSDTALYTSDQSLICRVDHPSCVHSGSPEHRPPQRSARTRNGDFHEVAETNPGLSPGISDLDRVHTDHGNKINSDKVSRAGRSRWQRMRDRTSNILSAVSSGQVFAVRQHMCAISTTWPDSGIPVLVTADEDE